MSRILCHIGPRLAAVGLAIALAGCAAPSPGSRTLAVPPQSEAPVPGLLDPVALWQHQNFPGKRATQYRSDRVENRDATHALAVSSASMLRRSVRIEPAELGALRFSWRVPALIALADLGDRNLADSPVRVVLAFEGDRSRLSARDAMLSELAHTLTGEPMPYATLIYVWCNQRPSESVIHSPRTARVRKLVMESGPQRLGRWLDYERDIRADFEKAFGEPPGALVAVGIMTDTDNTGETAQAWYGPLALGTATKGN